MRMRRSSSTHNTRPRSRVTPGPVPVAGDASDYGTAPSLTDAAGAVMNKFHAWAGGAVGGMKDGQEARLLLCNYVKNCQILLRLVISVTRACSRGDRRSRAGARGTGVLGPDGRAAESGGRAAGGAAAL